MDPNSEPEVGPPGPVSGPALTFEMLRRSCSFQAYGLARNGSLLVPYLRTTTSGSGAGKRQRNWASFRVHVKEEMSPKMGPRRIPFRAGFDVAKVGSLAIRCGLPG